MKCEYSEQCQQEGTERVLSLSENVIRHKLLCPKCAEHARLAGVGAIGTRITVSIRGPVSPLDALGNRKSLHQAP